MGRKSKFPGEVRERAVRLALEQQNSDESQWAAIVSLAAKTGRTPDFAQADLDRRPK